MSEKKLSPQKIYETGLLYYHYANTAYPLTVRSFTDYKVSDIEGIKALLSRVWSGAGDYCLYLHIPFCQKRCRFCDYTVLENSSEALEGEYTGLLLEEMKMYAPLVSGREAIGFDIGGGTPLKLSVSNLRRLVDGANSLFHFKEGILRSIETTPVIAAREPEKLRVVRKLGFERISMGIQTVSPRLLEELGRAGEPHIYEQAVKNIRAAGFARFNIDLMYGFLHQSDKDLETTLLYAIALEPSEITLYRNYYKGTRLEEEAGGVSLYKVMRQYRLAYELLEKHGYHSNVGRNTFTREEGSWGTSDYLTHRVVDGTPYLGLGLGAQSFGNGYLSYNEGAATKTLEAYRNKVREHEFPLQDIYDLPQEECMAKMLAVSFYFGMVDLGGFEKRFGVSLQSQFPEEVAFLQHHQLMEERDGMLMLTARGAGYVNGIIPLFYTERSKAELLTLCEHRREPSSDGERKFLAGYSIEKYPRPSVTTDVVAMTLRSVASANYRSAEERGLAVLLIRRGEHPFMNQWALPGGFLRQGETVEHCAQRELFEETALNTRALLPLGCFSEDGRDPRGWIISNAFLSVVGRDERELMSGDDAMDARWFDLSFRECDDRLILRFVNGDVRLEAVLRLTQDAFGSFAFQVLSSDLAFDHAKILATALKKLQSPEGLQGLPFAFLPAEFTLNDLQKVYELLTGHQELAANFRRKMLPLLEETERYTGGAGHRPAQLYRRAAQRPEGGAGVSSQEFLAQFVPANDVGDIRRLHELRIAVYAATVAAVKAGEYMADGRVVRLPEPQNMMVNSCLYTRAPRINAPALDTPTDIEVWNSDSLLAGKRLLDAGFHPAVLNFASRRSAGGGVINGSGAQEENIFRRTNIFMSLYQFHPHGIEFGVPQRKEQYPLDRVSGGAYSPEVAVFRGTEADGYPWLETPYQVGIVTVPALNRPQLKNENELADAMVAPTLERMRAIFRIALTHGHDALVLGAWGCGAFANPPEHIARLFHQLLEDPEFVNRFRKVVFAIIDRSHVDINGYKSGNFTAFQNEFQKNAPPHP